MNERPDTDSPTERYRQRLESLRAQRDASWKNRAQGWLHRSLPIPLEPPFPAPQNRPATESDRLGSNQENPNTGLIRQLSDSIRARLAHVGPQESEDDQPLVELLVSLPSTLTVSPETYAQLLLSLTYIPHPFSFEVVGSHDAVRVLLVCRENERDNLVQQVQAHVPDATMTQLDGCLASVWGEAEGAETVIKEFGLAREYLFPIRTFRSQELDPLIATVAALENLDRGEVGLLQILFQSARAPWTDELRRMIGDPDTRILFADAASRVQHTRKKIASPLYAVVVRIAAKSGTSERAESVFRALSGSLAAFANPDSNELVPLTTTHDLESDHEEDVVLRRTRRSGMLLNSEELASLVHFPSASVRSPKLKREEGRTRAAPAIASGHALVLGENVHAGATTPVTLSAEQRTQHVHVIGRSGTGKSTFLLNLIRQDIENGEGLAVLDPHGDLIDQVVAYIPESRYADVVYFDPSDGEYPVGFNILSAHSEEEKVLLASDLVAVFRRLSTSWGDQMTSVLANAILAFLESEQGGTLADMRRFLVEPQFRKAFLGTVRDSEVVYYWQKEFPLLTGRPQAPLLTRLDTFLRHKLVRHIVAQKDNRLDIGAIMNEGKIFLAKLAQGAIGEENAHLLGSLLVSKFHQLAMSRQNVPEAQRRNFSLYIDEFHNFVTPSMEAILTGARKYRLGLVLAHQSLDQLSKGDADVTTAVLSAYTRVCFRVGESDARKLAEGFSFFEPRHLQNLGKGEAIARMERAEYDFSLRTVPTPIVDATVAAQRKAAVIAKSREQYGTPRSEVEAALTRGRQDSPQVSAPAPVQHVPPAQIVSTPRAPRAESVPDATPSPTPGEPPPRITRRPKSAPDAPPPMGRGGPEHKYLQDLIKRFGEAMGYHAIIEKPILDGKGSVDVALEKEGRSVACEISITTAVDQEVGNALKCLAAGFQHVLVVSADQRKRDVVLNRLREQAAPDEMQKVHGLGPEEVYTFLRSLEAEEVSTEQVVGGRKVTRTFKRLAEGDEKTRHSSVLQVVLDSLKRLK